MRLRSGNSEVGTQNRDFSGKSCNKHEKMGSQTGSGKRVLSWRGQNLKSDNPYNTLGCFLDGPGLPKRRQNRRGNGPGLHRGLKKVIFGRCQKSTKKKKEKGQATNLVNGTVVPLKNYHNGYLAGPNGHQFTPLVPRGHGGGYILRLWRSRDARMNPCRQASTERQDAGQSWFRKVYNIRN